MKIFYLLILSLFSFFSHSALQITNSSGFQSSVLLAQAPPYYCGTSIQSCYDGLSSSHSGLEGYQKSTFTSTGPNLYVNYQKSGHQTYSFSFRISGDSGSCNSYEECLIHANDECESQQTTLDQSSYVYRSYNDYDSTCTPPPPEQPIKDKEECTNHSNNQCNTRGSVVESIFTDNGNSTYSCDYTCGDGTTGDENGSNSNEPNGNCDPDDPNDLADCDVADNEDPDCVFGCGDAFTPDPTNDIDYDPDGTNTSDGTGTDGITTTQGDVLINEVKKLKNNNAEQIIKGSNKVVDAVDSINPNDKLSELITAVKDNKPLPSDGSGNNFNDTNIVSSINSLQQSVNQGAADTVSAIEGNSLNNVIGNSLAYDTSNFDSTLSDTAQLDVRIAQGEQTLKDKMSLYKTTLTSQLSFLTPMSSGYSTNNLVLSQGSYDVSWSRFSQYFSTIGTIVYALAGLISLSILFVGRF
jgi:hypothetical protein